jgi:hypothetical protein
LRIYGTFVDYISYRAAQLPVPDPKKEVAVGPEALGSE